MAGTIINLIRNGFTAASVLNGIVRGNKKYSSTINNALAAGYTAQSVLKRLVGDKSNDQQKYFTASENAERNYSKSRSKAITKAAAASSAIGALSSILSQSGAREPSETSEENPTDIIDITNASPQTENVPTTARTSTESPFSLKNLQNQTSPAAEENVAQESEPSSSPLQENVKNFFETSVGRNFPAVAKFVKKHIESGFEDENINQILQKSPALSPLIKKYEQETGASFLNAIRDIGLGASNKTEQVSPEGTQEESIEPISEAIESNRTIRPMITPRGLIGQVTHQKDGTSILQVGDRKIKEKTADLQPIPAEWENVHVDLTKVPEEDRSASLRMFGASEDRTSVISRFWDNGKPVLYLYQRKDGQPFDEQLLESVANEVDAPISSGIQFAGAWSPEGKSRGSAFHFKIKEMAQDSKKTDDPSKPFFFIRLPYKFQHGFDTTFDKQLNLAKEKFNAGRKTEKRSKKSN